MVLDRLPVSVKRGGLRRPPAKQPSTSSLNLTSVDADSRAWLESLGADGQVREDAIARLHALLLQAARFEVSRRRRGLHGFDGVELDAISCLDDACYAVGAGGVYYVTSDVFLAIVDNTGLSGISCFVGSVGSGAGISKASTPAFCNDACNSSD